MGKDAHPFGGKIWVSLPMACGTPLGLVLGDQSACRLSITAVDGVSREVRPAFWRQHGVKAQAEAHCACKWVRVQIRQRDTK